MPKIKDGGELNLLQIVTIIKYKTEYKYAYILSLK